MQQKDQRRRIEKKLNTFGKTSPNWRTRFEMNIETKYALYLDFSWVDFF